MGTIFTPIFLLWVILPGPRPHTFFLGGHAEILGETQGRRGGVMKKWDLSHGNMGWTGSNVLAKGYFFPFPWNIWLFTVICQVFQSDKGPSPDLGSRGPCDPRWQFFGIHQQLRRTHVDLSRALEGVGASGRSLRGCLAPSGRTSFAAPSGPRFLGDLSNPWRAIQAIVQNKKGLSKVLCFNLPSIVSWYLQSLSIY